MNHPRIVRLITALFFTGIMILQCSDKKQGPAVGPSDFPWGTGQDQTISKLSAQGWVLEDQSAEKAELSFPVAEDAKIKDSKLFSEAEEPSEPFTVELFFKDGKLTIVTIKRRDTTDKIDDFLKSIYADYDIEPSSDTVARKDTTDTGNVITSSQQISESPEYVLKLNRTSIEPSEEKMKGGLNDQVEIQVFPKSYNEGISAEALKQN
ncbi:MAG: hypothetical protein KDK37_00650 [Leptospiraceae bacterium]|nr:hypothetical protein [Leptospiraceae bacterium]